MDNFRRVVVGIVVMVLFIIAILFLLLVPWGRQVEDVFDPNDPNNLLQYSDSNVQFRMVTRGAIIGNAEHRQSEIIVGRDRTTMTVYSGYQDRILRSESYSNNPEAYADFLGALMNSDFTAKKPAPLDVEVVGACPRRLQYFFEIIDGDEVLHESWATQCSRSLGTFDGKTTDTLWLFRNQITDYRDLVRGMNLN